MSSTASLSLEIKKVSIYAKLSLLSFLLLFVSYVVDQLIPSHEQSRIWTVTVVYIHIPALIVGTVSAIATIPLFFMRPAAERTWLDFICIVPMVLECINLLTGAIKLSL